ncbi:hypothetical protein Bca4012_002347 [Brassica carinata]
MTTDPDSGHMNTNHDSNPNHISTNNHVSPSQASPANVSPNHHSLNHTSSNHERQQPPLHVSSSTPFTHLLMYLMWWFHRKANK